MRWIKLVIAAACIAVVKGFGVPSATLVVRTKIKQRLSASKAPVEGQSNTSTAKRPKKVSKTAGSASASESEDGKDRQLVTLTELRDLKLRGELDPNVIYVTEAMLRREDPKLLSKMKQMGDDSTEPKTPQEVSREKLERARKIAASTARDRTGFKFRDEEGEYDVPILDQPRWFWLQTRKNSERKICETIKGIGRNKPIFAGRIISAYHPERVTIKMKGKGLGCSFKPMIPGLIYVKVKVRVG